MNKKAKLKIALSSIIMSVSVSYLVQYWFRHSGLEGKMLDKYDDIKNIIKGVK
jgi:hypothetical protein